MKSIRWWYRDGYSAELLQDDAGNEHFRLNGTTMPLRDWRAEDISEHATKDTPAWRLASWLYEARSNYYDNLEGIIVSVEGRHYSAHLFRNQEEETMFSYGCESYPLQEWTEGLVDKLVVKWVIPEKYDNCTQDINNALMLARKHADQLKLEEHR
jgi:hypothetical protein